MQKSSSKFNHRRKVLVVGHFYHDLSYLKFFPSGDEKLLAPYCISFGGNAVTAAFLMQKLGLSAHLICNLPEDDYGYAQVRTIERHRMPFYPRAVERSSFSAISSMRGQRAIIRGRDDTYLEDFVRLETDGFEAFHTDGHMSDAALHYARKFSRKGIPTFLDGGTYRGRRTHALLPYIRVAIVSEDFCRQRRDTNAYETLEYLEKRGCRVGGVTAGPKGTLWFDERGRRHHTPAYDLPNRSVIDTLGAGDTYHGAFVWSYLQFRSVRRRNFIDATAAAAQHVKRLGNELSIPSVKEIEQIKKRCRVSTHIWDGRLA